ncbi:probable WRKY transcription factor 11 [Phragmites australis]|uniref:probable WRKY transcription factor 11 n=1 Tax=Phragmites australis TaxID=29695 RepID=UPI002D799F04|nr:probable WRKY transcription factor 11 [Phragmites australis]
MDMEEALAGTAQGDLSDVVARASAMAALPSTSHLQPPPPFPATDHMSSPAMAGQIMTPYEEDRRLAVSIACSDAMMFEGAPSTADPYLSSATAPRGGYWLPPQQLAVQISQHACYGRDVAMGGAVTDVDGDEAMRISPVTPAAHQMMKRNNEVKKVVCIPALPATSSRPGGGEVIPSDLWAWRKYGQKPIKGSPYPRGYYRCSSSKGCMARKQVERSRSDPNMLVITYTAEHNHPWPMQRNVLAGYSRPHTHVSPNCKKKKSCRVDPASSSSSSSSSNIINYYPQQNVFVGGDLDFQLQTNIIEGNAAGYVACAIGGLGGEGVVMHEPTSCNGIQTADEVFAELEELEPSNPVNANVYSRGVSYEWHKF